MNQVWQLDFSEYQTTISGTRRIAERRDQRVNCKFDAQVSPTASMLDAVTAVEFALVDADALIGHPLIEDCTVDGASRAAPKHARLGPRRRTHRTHSSRSIPARGSSSLTRPRHGNVPRTRLPARGRYPRRRADASTSPRVRTSHAGLPMTSKQLLSPQQPAPQNSRLDDACRSVRGADTGSSGSGV